MQQDDVFLSIDMGTQSVRALLVDLKGQVKGMGKVEVVPYFSTQPGWAEQDVECYWDALGQACKALWAHCESLERPDLRSSVVGIALTTQRGTVVVTDSLGRALRPAVLWLDQRQAQLSKSLPRQWSLIFKALRLSGTVKEFETKVLANWLQQHEPETWAQVSQYLLLSGYMTHRLTGNFCDSVGCQVGYVPFDYRNHRWASVKDWRWAISDVAGSMLPNLKQPGEILGKITLQAAQHLGLPEGIPLIAAASDKACEVLGSGALTPEIACLSFGTTATVNTTRTRYVEVTPFIPPFPAAVPGAFNTETMIYRGFWMVSWFKEQFAAQERQEALRRGCSTEAVLEGLANQVSPGSMGLVLQPYWSPGRRVPGPEAKGAIIGFGDVHHKGHLYRALLEGLAYGLRQGKECIERKTGETVKRLRVSGGGSQSRLALQITADVFGLPLEKPHTHETSGIGAAINAAVGLGYYASYSEAVSKMTHQSEIIEPDPENVALYDRLYKEVYGPLYGRLSPLYRAIRSITGYPKKL